MADESAFRTRGRFNLITRTCESGGLAVRIKGSGVALDKLELVAVETVTLEGEEGGTGDACSACSGAMVLDIVCHSRKWGNAANMSDWKVEFWEEECVL